MATSASAAPSTAPRLRLTIVHDDVRVPKGGGDSNADPPESQADAPADTSCAASPPRASSSATIIAGNRAEAYLEQEGQKASHVFAGLTPDPNNDDEASSENDSPSSTSEEVGRSLSMAKPATLVLDCPCPSSLLVDTNTQKDGTTMQRLPFRYGGLELRVNSRNVEVYLTEQSTGEERYVVTSRGVKDGESESNNHHKKSRVEWHKFVIVNRGGPATVTSVRIKMVSVKPADCNAVYVNGCKVKAKVLSAEEARAAVSVAGGGGNTSSNGMTTPQRAAPQAAPSPVGGGMSSMAQMMMAMGTGGGQPQPQPQAQPPSMAALMAMMGAGPPGGIPGMPATPAAPPAGQLLTPSQQPSSSSSMPSHADMGMAISALRTMVSSTEESLNRRIIESTQQLDASMAARIKGLESKVTKLSDQVEEQSEVILRQRRFIVEQSDALTTMEANQNAMMEQILEGQSKLMDVLERNLQAKNMVEICDGEFQSDTEPHAIESALSSEQIPAEVAAETTDDMTVEASVETQEEVDAKAQLVNNGAMSDPTNEATTTSKPPVMTYRGAENLMSFEGDKEEATADGALPNPEQLQIEAISDLLMSTVDETG